MISKFYSTINTFNLRSNYPALGPLATVLFWRNWQAKNIYVFKISLVGQKFEIILNYHEIFIIHWSDELTSLRVHSTHSWLVKKAAQKGEVEKPLGSSINHVVKILGIFDPLPPSWSLLLMVIWLTPPPQLSSWFIDVPYAKYTYLYLFESSSPRQQSSSKKLQTL